MEKEHHSQLSRAASTFKGVGSRIRQISTGKPPAVFRGPSSLTKESVDFSEEADRRALQLEGEMNQRRKDQAERCGAPGAENLVLPDDKRDSWTALGLGRVSIIRFRARACC